MTRWSSSGWDLICRSRLDTPSFATGSLLSSSRDGSELTENGDHLAEDAAFGVHGERRHRGVLGNELDRRALPAETADGGLLLRRTREERGDDVPVVGVVLSTDHDDVAIQDAGAGHG